MKIFPEFPSIVFDDLTKKYSIEITAKDAIEADNQRKQILQDHEDAEYWHKWVGNQSLQEILDVWKKDRQIVKRLEESIIEISKGSIESLMLKEYNYDISQEVMEILQKILEGKK